MGSEETEHDATGALITLVAGHMLNVHPVMHAATATVGGSDPREGQEKGGGREGQDAVGTFYLQRRAPPRNVAAVQITFNLPGPFFRLDSSHFFLFFFHALISFESSRDSLGKIMRRK